MLTFGCSNQTRSSWLNFASPSRDNGETRRAFSPDNTLDQTTALQRYMSEKKNSSYNTLQNTSLKPSKDIARNMK